MLIRQLAASAAAQPPFLSRGICLEGRLQQTHARLYSQLDPTSVRINARTGTNKTYALHEDALTS